MKGHEAARWYQERAGEARELVARYKELLEHTRVMRAKVSEEAAAARKVLAEAYLEDLGPDSLARMSKLTGFNGFKRRSPTMAMEQEAKVLQRRIAEILADDRYQRRQWLVGPEGELTRGRAEVWEMYEPWQRDALRYEDIIGFLELVDLKYDTPEFETKWYEPAYWRQWATGDRICEELGVNDFGDDVLPEYRRIAAERDKWDAEVRRWDARILEVHDLVAEHDGAVERIPRLPEIYLDSSQGVLAGFLEHADASLLDQWCLKEDPPDRAVRMALRRVAGLKAKVDFLSEFIDQGLEQAIDGFEARVSKYDRKAVKYNRNKHRGRSLSSSEIDSGFVEKRDKYHARADKLRSLMDRVGAYDRYDRFELSNEPELWWVEMTGKAPSSFTPRLQTWYSRHRDARPAYDTSLDLDAEETGMAAGMAVAEAMSAADDLGYLS